MTQAVNKRSILAEYNDVSLSDKKGRVQLALNALGLENRNERQEQTSYFVLEKYAKKVLKKIMDGEALDDADNVRLQAAYEYAGDLNAWSKNVKDNRYQFDKRRKEIETNIAEQLCSEKALSALEQVMQEPILDDDKSVMHEVVDLDLLSQASKQEDAPALRAVAPMVEREPVRENRFISALKGFTSLFTPRRLVMGATAAAVLVVAMATPLNNVFNSNDVTLNNDQPAMTDVADVHNEGKPVIGLSSAARTASVMGMDLPQLSGDVAIPTIDEVASNNTVEIPAMPFTLDGELNLTSDVETVVANADATAGAGVETEEVEVEVTASVPTVPVSLLEGMYAGTTSDDIAAAIGLNDKTSVQIVETEAASTDLQDDDGIRTVSLVTITGEANDLQLASLTTFSPEGYNAHGFSGFHAISEAPDLVVDQNENAAETAEAPAEAEVASVDNVADVPVELDQTKLADGNVPVSFDGASLSQDGTVVVDFDPAKLQPIQVAAVDFDASMLADTPADQPVEFNAAALSDAVVEPVTFDPIMVADSSTSDANATVEVEPVQSVEAPVETTLTVDTIDEGITALFQDAGMSVPAEIQKQLDLAEKMEGNSQYDAYRMYEAAAAVSKHIKGDVAYSFTMNAFDVIAQSGERGVSDLAQQATDAKEWMAKRFNVSYTPK